MVPKIREIRSFLTVKAVAAIPDRERPVGTKQNPKCASAPVTSREMTNNEPLVVIRPHPP